jgi:DNA-directed RNA polymerase specialized sigma24 family protein
MQEITDPGKVYAWIRTATHRALNRRAQHRVREFAVDPLEGGLDENASEDPTPEEADRPRGKGEIATLVREVVADLPQRHRQVLALHVDGLKRPEIASRLRLTERGEARSPLLAGIMAAVMVFLVSEVPLRLIEYRRRR